MPAVDPGQSFLPSFPDPSSGAGQRVQTTAPVPRDGRVVESNSNVYLRPTSSLKYKAKGANPLASAAKGFLKGFGGWHRGSGSAAVFSEIQRGAAADSAQLVAQFRTLNRDIRRICDNTATTISLVKQLPKRPERPEPYVLLTPSDLERPRWDFASTEDYCFYVLLSVVNTQLWDSIFRPFHPSDPAGKAVPLLVEGRIKQTNHVQRDVALARSLRFAEMEDRFLLHVEDREALVQSIAAGIIAELLIIFSTLPGAPAFIPPEFIPELEGIVKSAYEWNCSAKRDLLEYDLQPFVPYPQTKWDPTHMEPFEVAGDVHIETTEGIVSPISLGLIATRALDTGPLSKVQERSKVLVDAWFRVPPPIEKPQAKSPPRERPTSSAPAPSSPAPAPTSDPQTPGPVPGPGGTPNSDPTTDQSKRAKSPARMTTDEAAKELQELM